MSARLVVSWLLVYLVASISAFALGAAGQTGAPASSAPTAIEQAIIEFRCNQTQAPGAPRTDVFQDCLRLHLVSLRNDFGRDLTRLSPAERKLLDTACNRVQAVKGRDGYVECVSAQLDPMRRRAASRAKPAPSPANESRAAAIPARPANAADPAATGVRLPAGASRSAAPAARATNESRPAESAAPAVESNAAEFPDASTEATALLEAGNSLESPVPPTTAAPSTLSPLLIGGALVALALAAGGALAAGSALMGTKAPTTTRTCRSCGDPLQDSGDLCQKCRREAAAARRAASDHADQALTEEELRRQSEEEEKRRRLKAFEEEEERLKQQEAARQADQLRREEESLEREEQLRRQQQAPTPSADLFDPHAVLGVGPGASADAIRAAYDEARAKYDPGHVAHLGVELQEHYKAKAEAVERAYELLTA